MSARSKYPASVRRSLCLAASILGLLGLSFGLAPGTVLAYNPNDIYTEGPPPATPPKDKKPEKKNPGKKKNPGNQEKPAKNNPGNQNDGGDDSGAVGTVVPDDGSGNPPAGSDGTGNSTGTNGAPVDTAQGGEPGAQENIAAGADNGTVAVTPASESKTDDGSALPLIIAILVGVPLIGFGAYYFWARRRSRDDDFHDLNSAYGGEQH